jgi:hypothetical protein
MPSAWVVERTTQKGKRRHVVRCRIGGRESPALHWHSYKRKREAEAARNYVAGELACGRAPDRRLQSAPSRTVTELAEAWRASRVDVSAGTRQTYAVAWNRLELRIGDVPVHELDAARVAELVAELHANGLRKQTIRKTISVLAMILDHARIEPNPARDKLTVRLPREEREQVQPPTAEARRGGRAPAAEALPAAGARARRDRHEDRRARTPDLV